MPKWMIGCLAAFGIFSFIAVGSCVLLALMMPQPPQVRQAQNAAPSQTPTPSKPKVKTIPGLAPVDIYLNLTSRGFSRSGPNRVGEIFSTVCKLSQDGVDFTCTIDGPTPSSVHRITAEVMQYSSPESETSQIATWFLGFVASVPYEGANTIGNRQWAEANTSGGEMDDGPVHFEIIAGAPRVRWLKIYMPETPAAP